MVEVMDCQIFHHCFDSWKVYPRLDYFHCRFKEVLPRFQRIAGALPKCFGSKKVIDDLERCAETFKKGFQVTIHGENDLDPDELLMVKGFEEVKRAQHHLITVHVYRIDGTALSVEQIKERVSYVASSLQDPDGLAQVLLSLDKNQTDHFKKHKEALDSLALDSQELRKNIPYSLERKFVQQFQIIFEFTRQFERINCPHDLENESSALKSVHMKKQIQDFLGSKYIFMEMFQPSSSSKDVDKSPADQTHAPKFSKGGSAMEVELKELSKEQEIEIVRKNVEENFHVLLNTIARKVRCAAVEFFADRYSLHSSVCNSFMTHVDFEDALAKCFVKNTKYHLKNLAVDILTPDSSPERKRIDFVLYRLEDDMEKVFKEFEKMFTSFKRLLSVMKKLSFEIEGYLKQSIVEDVQATLTKSSPEIGDSLREDLLSIKEVYGVGTFYGKLEIHISTKGRKTNEQDAKDAANRRLKQENTLDTKKQKKEDVSDEDKSETEVLEKDGVNLSTTPCSETATILGGKSENAEPQKDACGLSSTPVGTSSENPEKDFITTTKSRIKEVLIKHRYWYPFSIKCVIKKPVLMCIIKPGDPVHSDSAAGTKAITYVGTCGAFCYMSNKLHGLTCGHVVGNSKKAKIHTSRSKTLISETQDVCSIGTTAFGCIDIAALKLVHNVELECKSRTKAGHRHFSQMQIWRSRLSNLQNSPVFKFGAGTGYTTGTIASTDYIRRPNAYLIMIEHDQDLPTDESFKFPSLSTCSSSVTHSSENFPPDPCYTQAQISENTGDRGSTDMDKSSPVSERETLDTFSDISEDTQCTEAHSRTTGMTKDITERNVKEVDKRCIIESSELDNQQKLNIFRNSKNDSDTDTDASNSSETFLSVAASKGVNLEMTTVAASENRGAEDQENGSDVSANQATRFPQNVRETNTKINSKSDTEIYRRERHPEPGISLATENINRDETNYTVNKNITLVSDCKKQFEANKSRPKAETKEITIGQINDCSGQTNYQTNGDIVFVRSKESLSKEDMTTDNHIFCKEGDSGAVVCVNILGSDCEEHFALSMLVGGDLKVSEDDRDDGTENDNFSCSFKLHTGLSALRRIF